MSGLILCYTAAACSNLTQRLKTCTRCYMQLQECNVPRQCLPDWSLSDHDAVPSHVHIQQHAVTQVQ
jgi:antirestriction protein